MSKWPRLNLALLRHRPAKYPASCTQDRKFHRELCRKSSTSTIYREGVSSADRPQNSLFRETRPLCLAESNSLETIKTMPQEIKYFMMAVQFLTRLPTDRVPGFNPNQSEVPAKYFPQRGAKYLPLVGVFIGLVSAVVLLVASLVWRGALPAVLAIAAGMALTGALHEDGFADFFDSMGGATREVRLTIMKDSRLGTYGALALGIGLAIKVLALSTLTPPTAVAALIAAHAGARSRPSRQ